MKHDFTILIINSSLDKQTLNIPAYIEHDYIYFQVISSFDTADNCQLIEKHKPNFLLLHYPHAHQQCIDVLKQLKNSHPLLPIIITSEYHKEAFEINIIRQGALEYINKSTFDFNLMCSIFVESSKRSLTFNEQSQILDTTFTVLIVDDNADDQELCIRSLNTVKQIDYNTLAISSGDYLIETIIEAQPNIILLDYSMPGYNGLQLIEKVHEEFPFLPVIMLTGQGNESIAVQALKQGAHDYILKRDINSKRLHDSIQATIKQAIIEEKLFKQELQIKTQRKELLESKRRLEETVQALLASQERTQLVIDGARDGIWDWPDMSKDEEYWSPQWKSLLGYAVDEIEAKASTFYSLLHPDDAKKTDLLIENSLKTKEPLEMEYRLKTKSGEYKWFQGKAVIKTEEKTGITRMVGSITDIDARKRVEEEIQETRAFQELIKESNPDLIFVKNKDFQIVDANSAFINVYPKEMHDKIFGYTTIEDYNEEEANAFLAMDRKAFNEGYSEVTETITFPDGNRRTLYTQKILFHNAKGEPFILGIGRDVTERELFIERLRASNEELENFAYIASHDLQEPLRMIVNFTGLLELEYLDKLDETAAEYLHFSSQAANRMQLLVSDLLEYSRISQEAERYSSVDCSKVLNSAKLNLSESIKQYNAIITHDDLPIILANPIRITRLLQNLIGNAIKYSKDNENPVIHIGIHESETEWTFHIQDNGIGMKPEYLEKIFIPFKRLHANNEYQGSGIGLAVCKKIVDSIGGRIWAESELNVGSIFYFTAPKQLNKEE